MTKKIKNKILNSYMIKNYRKIFPYVKPYWKRALIAMLITLPMGAMDAVIAWALKPYMDVVMIEKAQFNTAYLPLIIIVFTFVQSLLNYTATYLNAWVGQKISNNIKITLFEKLLTYSAKFYDTRTSGEILQRFSGDVDTACNGLLSSVKLFTTRVFSSISLIVVLFYNSWQLAILGVVILFSALFPLTRIRKKIKGFVHQSVQQSASLMTNYNETFAGNKIVSSYNLAPYFSKKFKNTLHKLFKLSIKVVKRTGVLSPMMHFIVSLGVAMVIWLGSYLIVTGKITPGNFVSFITALILLYQPIKGIGNTFNAVQLSLLAMERVFVLLDGSSDIQNCAEPKLLTNIGSGIKYNKVCFEYEKGKPVLTNVSLEIKPGETYAFVGNSGGGKSTIANILPRFYDINSGSITINDIDVREYDLHSLRDNIAVVFQDNFLFSGTIRDNIMLGNPQADEKEIQKAIKNACLEEFIAGLKKGLDTDIGEKGVLLSGGQRQRIGIARAFLKNAPIVILDEATSALDNKSEAVVQKAIENLMKDRTVLIIAHRLSTIKNADKIVVVNHGKVAEIGSHEELISKPNGAYAALYKTQVK